MAAGTLASACAAQATPLAAEEEDRSDIEDADHHHGDERLARSLRSINATGLPELI
jgi:hypothetical protein